MLIPEPKTNEEVERAIDQVFKNIFAEYKPDRHVPLTTFITNLPIETEKYIKSIIHQKHRLIFNEKAAANAIKPLIDTLMNHGNNQH